MLQSSIRFQPGVQDAYAFSGWVAKVSKNMGANPNFPEGQRFCIFLQNMTHLHLLRRPQSSNRLTVVVDGISIFSLIEHILDWHRGTITVWSKQHHGYLNHLTSWDIAFRNNYIASSEHVIKHTISNQHIFCDKIRTAQRPCRARSWRCSPPSSPARGPSCGPPTA